MNCLEAAHTWVGEDGYRDWLAVAYTVHRRRILTLFERHGAFAEAVQEFDNDPDLVARAKAAEEEQRREFEATYGHLRSD